MTAQTTTASMFESIKGALEKADKSSGYRDLMKLEPGKTYLVRLLPNCKNPEDTFYHYFHHGWKSVLTGKYVSAISPSTWEERCPISEEYFKLYREAGNDKAKLEVVKNLKRKESWYVNVYVIADPTTPDNVGKVKILRFGKQLMKIIESAISGDDAKEYGPKIFELGDSGCTFRIKPEKKSEKGRSDFAIEYVASRFLSPGNDTTGLSEEKQQEVLNSLHELNTIDERSSEAELLKMLSMHFYGQKDEAASSDEDSGEQTKEKSNALAAAAKAATAKASKPATPPADDDEGGLDMSPPKTKTVTTPVTEKKADAKPVTVSVDDADAIEALLDGLNQG